MQSADRLPILTLAHVIEGFAQWRASGDSKYRTPLHLQQQAVALLEHHPKSLICKSLNIPYSTLKQWVMQIAQSDAVTASQHDTATASTDNAGFIQLPTTQCPQSESMPIDAIAYHIAQRHSAVYHDTHTHAAHSDQPTH